MYHGTKALYECDQCKTQKLVAVDTVPTGWFTGEIFVPIGGIAARRRFAVCSEVCFRKQIEAMIEEWKRGYGHHGA